MFLKFFTFATALSALVDASEPSYLRTRGTEGNGVSDLKVVVYETGDYSTSLQFFLKATEKHGLESIVVGQGSYFKGFGSKYTQLKDTLDELNNDSESLVAVVDGRDVLLNMGNEANSDQFQQRVNLFIQKFKDLTADKPEAVLVSAEQQCCVAALCHADSPSYYFDPVTGERTERACASGKEGCFWESNANVEFWQAMMEQEAHARTTLENASPYLNAGMMVGTPQNLINLIHRMDLGEEEDDQAVLSAMYLQYPDLIVLDYNQELLGNNAWPKGLEHGCIYDFDSDTEGNSHLKNTQTGTAPLIVHTPGKFYECLDTLIERLGGVSDKRYQDTQRHLQRNYGSNYNYNYNYNLNYDNAATPVAPSEKPSNAPSRFHNFGSIPETIGPSASPTGIEEVLDCSEEGCSNLLSYPNLAFDRQNPERFSMKECHGDCDKDADCEFGLVCFQRDMGVHTIPFCHGNADLVGQSAYSDFCVKPGFVLPPEEPKPWLVLKGNDWYPVDAFPLQECEGDCDEDSDCSGDLKCFQRDGNEIVPGCENGGSPGYDYCYDPTNSSKTSRAAPVSARKTKKGFWGSIKEFWSSVFHIL